MDIKIYPAVNPRSHQLLIIEKISGEAIVYRYPYEVPNKGEQNLKVNVDSISGELAIFINGSHIATHNTSVVLREGLTGLNSGNSGGYFDYFELIFPTPSHMDECKKGGWESFTTPTFKNQGECVSFVQSSANN